MIKGRQGIQRKVPQKRVAGRLSAKKGGKLPSISKLIKEADRLLSNQTRMKGAWMQDGVWWNKDYTTDYTAPVSKLHCGHYLSRYFKAARWHEDNVRPQSYASNIIMKGDSVKFRQNLVKEIGEKRVLAVESLRNAPIKLSREYLEDLILHLKGLSQDPHDISKAKHE